MTTPSTLTVCLARHLSVFCYCLPVPARSLYLKIDYEIDIFTILFPACLLYLLDYSYFLPVFIYLIVVIYLPVLCTIYLLSIASLGVWYSSLPVTVCFPVRLWSSTAFALALSFVLSHLSRDGRLVESHSDARVA